MSLEERLVNRDRLHRGDFRVAVELDHAIDHQEWVTMREHLHHFIGAQAAITARHFSRHFQFAPARLFLRKRAR